MAAKRLATMFLGAVALCSPCQASVEEKPVRVRADAVASEVDGRSFARLNIFYKFLETDAFTFIEMYSDDKNYFGKTILGRKLGGGFFAAGEYVFGSDVNNRAGIGIKYSLPLPKGAKFAVKVLPVWFSQDGYDKHRVQVGYSGNVGLPEGFEVLSFGQCNLAATNGPKWIDGEIFAGKKLGKRAGAYVGVLLRDLSGEENKLIPGIEFAGRISYSF